MNEQANLGPGGYGPPPGGYGPPPGGGGYGGPPGGGGYGGPPGGGGYGGPPGGPPPGGGYGGPPPGGFGGGGPGFGPGAPMGMPGGMGGPTSNGLAIAALVCGILSIPTSCCCSLLSIPLGIAAAVMGGLAMSKAKAQPEAYGGKGMALGGLICGIIAIVLSIALLALGMGQALVDQYNHSH